MENVPYSFTLAYVASQDFLSSAPVIPDASPVWSFFGTPNAGGVDQPRTTVFLAVNLLSSVYCRWLIPAKWKLSCDPPATFSPSDLPSAVSDVHYAEVPDRVQHV